MQWFDAIDKDGNNELTAVELQAALQLGNLNFSLATVAHIIRIHDKTGSSTINFEEFGKLHEFLTNVQQRCVHMLAQCLQDLAAAGICYNKTKQNSAELACSALHGYVAALPTYSVMWCSTEGV
jgi:hypothetical protein